MTDSSDTLALTIHDKGKVGMIAFLVTEVAFFSTLVVAYITYIGASTSGPTPKEVFKMPLVLASTICLLSSSVTIHLAGNALRKGDPRAFRGWWIGTIALGALFLLGTGVEWHDLIWNWRLLPRTNLFGTTYFTLVGFHAFHVTIGLLVMSMLLGFTLISPSLPEGGGEGRGEGGPDDRPLNVELVSWYWHFVDGVWVVVFTVVYVIGR